MVLMRGEYSLVRMTCDGIGIAGSKYGLSHLTYNVLARLQG
jgi:hypothetical protein